MPEYRLHNTLNVPALWRRVCCLGFLFAVAGATEAHQGQTELLTLGQPGPMQANRSSLTPSMTPDGRFIAFSSIASNLVPADSNNVKDVFVFDRQTDMLERVSISSDGVEGNGKSLLPAISGNGRYVAFVSEADNLVPDDNNGVADIFVHDRLTGETRRVSVDSNGIEANGSSSGPAISFTGRYVAFQSTASNLVADDTNGHTDIFVHDMDTGETTRVSVDSSGLESDRASSEPSISGNGRFVAFRSGATNLVPGQANGRVHTYVHDRDTGATTRVSVDSNGAQADDSSFSHSVSGGGRYVVFRSSATNLVSNITNNARDIFVHDRNTGITTRVSVSSDGTQGNGNSDFPAISVDGRYVTFSSVATNLVEGAANGILNGFIHDRQTGLTERFSVNEAGIQANGPVTGRAPVSSDGQIVVFASEADNLVANDTNRWSDIFVRNRPAETTNRISQGPISSQGNAASEKPRISADGCQVAFASDATNLAAGSTNLFTDIYVHDCQLGAITRVSVASDATEANGRSHDATISADGRFVAFASEASNLVADDTNGFTDIFVHDRQTGITTRVSVASDGSEANDSSHRPALSADGRYVVFHSDASNLVADDTNAARDVFVHDRTTGLTERVSIGSNGDEANDRSFGASISDDGNLVAFASYASNLTEDPPTGNIETYVHNRTTGLTTWVSVSSDGSKPDEDSDEGMISGNGRYVVFRSYASNLVPDVNNDRGDIFVHDLETGITERVSISSDGQEGNDESYEPAISADGRYVAFTSDADNLVPDDTNESPDVFVHDRQTGTTLLVSRSSSGELAEQSGESFNPSLSADGRFVAFDSTASNLVKADTNGFRDIFRRDLDPPLQQPILAVEPKLLDFGQVPVGTISSPRTLTISNPGNAALEVMAIGAVNAPFLTSGGTCTPPPFTLDPDASCTLQIRFAPGLAGPASMMLEISSNAPLDPTQTVTLQGQGLIPQLTLNIVRQGQGLITSDPTGIDCGEVCQAEFDPGTDVVLTAQPEPGWELVTWGGAAAACGNALQCTVAMKQNRTVGALFAQPGSPVLALNPSLLDFEQVPVGSSSAPQTLTIGNPGSADLEVTAIGTVNAPFASGGGSCAAPPFTLPPGTTCTRQFTFSPTQSGPASAAVEVSSNAPVNPTQTVSLQGQGVVAQASLTVQRQGQGLITSNPAGIDCGEICQASFELNSQITLSANPAPGWELVSWGGAGAACGNALQCTVTMDQNRTVGALFQLSDDRLFSDRFQF